MINSSPKTTPPIGKNGFFVQVWEIWFDRLKAAIDSTGLFVKNQAQISTTDAVQTTIQTLPLEESTTYNIKALIIGTNSSDRASYEIECTAYRLASNAVIEGAVTNIHSAESDSNFDATFTSNGNNINVSVTGVATTSIKWGCFLEWIKVKND